MVNNLRKDLLNLNLHKEKEFDHILVEYFDTCKKFNIYNYITNKLFIEKIKKIDHKINNIFDFDNLNQYFKKQENLLYKNFESVNEKNKYLFFTFLNYDSNSVLFLNKKKLIDYFLYYELNQKNISNIDLIENINIINNLEINKNVHMLINSINDIIDLINHNELLNFNQIIETIESEYNFILQKYESLDTLIEKDILEINDSNFFYFKLSNTNIKKKYNEIIEYTDIKKEEIETSENYNSFIIFYKIVVKINKKIDDIEVKLNEYNNKNLKIKEEIKLINDKKNNCQKNIIKLNKKTNNNRNRNNKISLIIDSCTNDNKELNVNQKYSEELREKISILNEKINSQKKEIYKLNSKLQTKKANINNLVDKVYELKNKEDILYKRYKTKLDNENNSKLDIINSINKIEEELKYNKKNSNLLNKELSKINEDNLKEENSQNILDIKNIDKQISKTKENEEDILKKISELDQKKDELEIEMKNNEIEIVKLKKEIKNLESDLYHNQTFLKYNFNDIFIKKYKLDNVKKILISLFTNIEEKDSLYEKLNKNYNSDIIIESLVSNYTHYRNIFKNIEYKLSIVNNFKNLSFHNNSKYQSKYLDFIKEIISILKIIYDFRINFHNYSHLKFLINYFKYKNNSKNNEDYKVEDKCDNIIQKLLGKEEIKILFFKSKIRLMNEINYENKENKKLKLINNIYEDIKEEIIEYNNIKKETLLLIKIQHKLIEKKRDLNSIYNYLISSI